MESNTTVPLLPTSGNEDLSDVGVDYGNLNDKMFTGVEGLSHTGASGSDSSQPHSHHQHQTPTSNIQRMSSQTMGINVNGSSESSSPEMDDRVHLLYQREQKWNEVRKYSEYIRRFANADSSQLEISKETYFDLYNMAVYLLKAIDGLDPDKMHVPSLPSQRKPPELSMSPTTAAIISQPIVPQSDTYTSMPRPPYDLYYQRGFIPAYPDVPPILLYDTQQAASTKKRSKRNSPHSTKRTLQCAMCGVTKTPEWRRGPSGDHTLCNACGLQYAKSLKKQKKDKERKSDETSMNQNDTVASIVSESNQQPIQ